MNIVFVFIAILIWVLGVVLGYFICKWHSNMPKIPDGIFLVDFSDPEEENFRLEVNHDVWTPVSKDWLYFKVQVKQ